MLAAAGFAESVHGERRLELIYGGMDSWQREKIKAALENNKQFGEGLAAEARRAEMVAKPAKPPPMPRPAPPSVKVEPPISDVPPGTTAAITSISNPTAAFDDPNPSRAAMTMPATAAASPVST